MEVTRTFDLIELGYRVSPREVMFGGKHGHEWVTYSTEAVREKTDLFSCGMCHWDIAGRSYSNHLTQQGEWNLVDHGLAQAG
jgi:hypothetical protein